MGLLLRYFSATELGWGCEEACKAWLASPSVFVMLVQLMCGTGCIALLVSTACSTCTGMLCQFTALFVCLPLDEGCIEGMHQNCLQSSLCKERHCSPSHKRLSWSRPLLWRTAPSFRSSGYMAPSFTVSSWQTIKPPCPPCIPQCGGFSDGPQPTPAVCALTLPACNSNINRSPVLVNSETNLATCLVFGSLEEKFGDLASLASLTEQVWLSGYAAMCWRA